MAGKKLNKETTGVGKFKDDDYMLIENEFEQIRTFLGMYISYTGTRAALHIFKEIFNNALDECVNKHSPANQVEVFFNEETREIIVNDNGRGIPFDTLYDVTTKKHSTTKNGRLFNVESAGQNGVGLKVTAALSDYFSITTYRGNESKTIEIVNNKIIEKKIVKEKKPRSGLVVKFIPSEEYLGKVDLKTENIETWLRLMSYIIPNGVTLKLYAQEKNNPKIIPKTYTNSGLSADVEYISYSLETSPIELGFTQGVGKDGLHDENENELLIIYDMAFSYDKTLDGEAIDSFCNYVHTIEHGEHVDSARSALCSFITREAKRLDPNSKYEIIYEDCKKGLVMAINCRTNNPKFGGQVKEKVTNEELGRDIRKNLIKELDKYFTENPSMLKKLVDYLRKIARIRLSTYSVKGISSSKPMTWLEESEIPGFYPLENRNSKTYKELIISEGESAAGGVLNIRNPKYQAVFRLLGVVQNTYPLTLQKAMDNQTLFNLVKVLGCGIGKDYNINNLRWDKIIIMTDSDVDGHNITSLLCAFFIKHLPGIIIEERLYKSIPPLYSLKDNKYIKEEKYLYSRNEIAEKFNKIVSANVDISLVYDNKKTVKMSKSEKDEWLNGNNKYLYYLTNLAKKSACEPYFIEVICWELLSCITKKGVDFAKFKKFIEKDFPETRFDLLDMSLNGSFNQKSITIIIDEIFIHNAYKFLNILRGKETLYITMKNKNSKDRDDKLMTIGQFLEAMNGTFTIDIDQRFKGVGEIESLPLFLTSVNPNLRKLYKLTMSNIETTMTTFEMLHGKNSSEDRKNLIKADFTLEDIDN